MRSPPPCSAPASLVRSTAAIPPRSDSRLEVIQELWFPTSCGRVKFSADGESMIATGCYPPQSRLYELRELSLKFSHHFVAGPLGRTSGHLWQRRSSAALSGSAAADRALSGSRSAAAAQLCRQPMAEASVVRPSGFRLPSRCRRPSCGLCAYPSPTTTGGHRPVPDPFHGLEEAGLPALGPHHRAALAGMCMLCSRAASRACEH